MTTNKKQSTETIKEPTYRIILSIGCAWCGQQVRDDEYEEHPRICAYFQEYLRQMV